MLRPPVHPRTVPQRTRLALAAALAVATVSIALFVLFREAGALDGPTRQTPLADPSAPAPPAINQTPDGQSPPPRTRPAETDPKPDQTPVEIERVDS